MVIESAAEGFLATSHLLWSQKSVCYIIYFPLQLSQAKNNAEKIKSGALI